jgi:hypothetical protein
MVLLHLNFLLIREFCGDINMNCEVMAAFFVGKPGNPYRGRCLCGGNVFVFFQTSLLKSILRTLKMPVQNLNNFESYLRKVDYTHSTFLNLWYKRYQGLTLYNIMKL